VAPPRRHDRARQRDLQGLKVYQDGQLIRTADPGTFHIAPGGNAEKANDGGWGGLYWQDDSTSHTDEATLNNWWQLDFG